MSALLIWLVILGVFYFGVATMILVAWLLFNPSDVQSYRPHRPPPITPSPRQEQLAAEASDVRSHRLNSTSAGRWSTCAPTPIRRFGASHDQPRPQRPA